MAAAGEVDDFGTHWRSPQRGNEPSASNDGEPKSVSSQDYSSPGSTNSTSQFDAVPATTASNMTMATLAHMISSATGNTNPFSISKKTSNTSTSSSTVRSSSNSDRERRSSHAKGSSSLSGEHAVKGGKTAKRGKSVKLKVLSFSDIENGFSCFGQSASSWADGLGEVSSDHMLTICDQQETNYAWDETGGGAGKRTKISHPTPHAMTAWDIDGGLAADFDGSFSGLGTELGTSSYNMSEALLALPVFKQENLENGFQYILGAATSPAVKMNEETLTYLNQGQSYEIKVKKLGDLSEYQGKCLRSVVKVQFHERRLQYMEKEQVDQWRQTRPGERILDMDIPLCYGLVDVKLDPSKINQGDFVWDPTKETGLYFKVHAISTEFTPKKHGGEKGVPFRIQIETYSHNDGEGKLLHAASCQIKVFKPKGADRKHKTDREKMEKRSEAEKEKYQPSYECTVLTEVPLDQVVMSHNMFGIKGSFSSLSNSFSELTCEAAAAGTGVAPLATTSCSTTTTTTTTSSPGPTPTRQLPPSPHTPPSSHPHHNPVHFSHHPLTNHLHSSGDSRSFVGPLSSEATATQVQTWLVQHRFSNYTRIFQHFSGADLLRLNRDDLIQICGLADGIRLDNALQAKTVRPRLSIFICQEPESVYHALYLDCVGVTQLRSKLAALFGVQTSFIGDMFLLGPSAIHIMMSDDVLNNIDDQSRFIVEGVKEESGDKYRILFKAVQ